VFISKLYVGELKWCINSECATLGHALLNVLLASRVPKEDISEPTRALPSMNSLL